MSDNVTPIRPDRTRRFGRKKLIIITAAVCVIVLLAAIVTVAVVNDLRDWGAVQRYFRYRNAASEEGFGTYSFDAQARQFTAFDSGLAVASRTGVQLLSDSSQELSETHANLASPALRSSGAWVLLGDLGGSTVALQHATRGEVLKLETEQPVLDLDLAETGAFCYIAAEGKYKAVIPVYSAEQELVYEWYSASAYFNQCAISPDGTQFAAVRIGQQDAAFVSTLCLFDTSSEGILAELPLGDVLVYELKYLSSNTICALTENGLIFVSDSAEERGRLDPAGTIEACDFGAGFAAAWIDSGMAGQKPNLCVLAPDGEIREVLEVTGTLLSFDVCGGYIAVLTTTGLSIYNESLRTVATTTETGASASVLLREDGTCILIGGGSAALYIP